MKCLGIDVGPASLRAVLLSKGLFGYRVLGMEDFPLSDMKPSEAVGLCLERLGTSADRIVMSVDRRRMAVRILELPTRDRSTIRKLAPFQMEGRVPFDGELMFDGLPLAEAGPSKASCLLVAVQKSTLDELMGLLPRVPLERLCFQSDWLASVNVLLDSHAAAKGNTVLVDARPEKTLVSLLVDNRLVAGRLLLSGLDGAESPDECARLASSLVSEMDRSRTALGISDVDRIFLCGEDRYLPSLQEALSGLTESSVEILRHRLLPPGKTSFSTALGLALGPFQVGLELDFHHNERPHPVFNRKNATATVMFLLLLAAAHMTFLYSQCHRLERLHNELLGRAELLQTRVSNSIKTLSEDDLRRAIAKTRRKISLLRRQMLSPTRTFLEVSRALRGKPVTLLAFTVRPDFVSIECETDSFATSDKVKGALALCPYFSDIEYERVLNVGPVSRRKLRFQLKFKRRPVGTRRKG